MGNKELMKLVDTQEVIKYEDMRNEKQRIM